MKFLFQDKIFENKEDKKAEKDLNKEMDWRNLNKNNDKYSQKNEVKDDFLLSNPYADLDNLENVD